MPAANCRGSALAESEDVNLSGLKFVHIKVNFITIELLA
jgi:hypothetical protein